MKIKNIFVNVSVNIIVIFFSLMVVSFIPDYAHELFGDWLCTGYEYGDKAMSCNYGAGLHEAQWHWGWRHWLWAIMGFFLFIVQVARVVDIIGNHQAGLSVNHNR